MRIIFSRKGFDSSAGGVPSPLIDGQLPMSLPIPTRMPSTTCFGDLASPIPSIVEDLTRGKVTRESPCHLDPDLAAEATRAKRLPGWRGSLGQVSSAQSHLDNRGVSEGDVFLFWGLFAPARRDANNCWTHFGPREHRIFGWLQVGEILRVPSEPESLLDERPWLRGHPHIAAGWPANNTVYVAAKHLNLPGKRARRAGFGTLERGVRLTAHDSSLASVWAVPAWLNPAEGGVGMTYHPNDRWSEGRVRAAARGQEFVAEIGDRSDALEWLLAVLRNEP